MPFKDVREFIARLEKEGEAQRIEEEVDWNLEAGAMVRRSGEAGLPAPFFQKVKDYPKGYRLFGGGGAKFSRVAIAMDMPKDTNPQIVVEEYLRRRKNLIKPVLVKDGPCKENVHTGKEVDLLEFPVPMIHAGDGGRYIGTWHLTINKDADSDWVNWGMYRHMMHNKNTIGVLPASPQQHLWSIFVRGYESRNKPMEVAIVIGPEPVSALCATTQVPYGVSEVDVAGGLRGEPVELIKCETIDLAVPATAEIVIEGEIRPHERMEEGRFGEFSGYSVPEKTLKPVIHVKAVTHRNNPIFTMSCPGVPVDDNGVMSIPMAGELFEVLKARGLPVTGVSVPAETVIMMAVVAVKPPYANVAEEIAHVVWGTKIGRTKAYLIIVEDDVDPWNMTQVLHALVTKCHPWRGIVRLEHTVGAGLCPFLTLHERKHFMGAKVYFDCTWPVDWEPSEIPDKISFKTAYPLEVQQKALAKWQKYGY